MHLNKEEDLIFDICERKISSVRRILEGTMRLNGQKSLYRDEFVTMLARAASIINNTPLWTVPDHPNDTCNVVDLEGTHRDPS